MPSSDPFSRLYGIIGTPLGHSLSPLVHNAEFRRLGLPCAYLRWEVSPGDLERFMGALELMKVHGLSVTIPHKQSVIRFLDAVDPAAVSIGAVNTIVRTERGFEGFNTDIDGFLSPLVAMKTPSSALVLGAGGAARAAIAGLKNLGVERIGISNRTASRARELSEEFGTDMVPWEERTGFAPVLLVNTTPLGMAGEMETLSPWPAEAFRESMAVYDLVYNPLKTCFLRDARKAGCRVVDGLNMFVGQAARQLELWTGAAMDTEGVRSLLCRKLFHNNGAA